MSAAALALILALLAGGASIATIASGGTTAFINIEKIEAHGGAPGAPAPRHFIQMTPLGPDNPSFDGK